MSDVEEVSEQNEEDSKADTNSVLSAENRLDNLLLNSGESKAGPERVEETPETGSKGRPYLGIDTEARVLSPRNDSTCTLFIQR
jgi:hypothetical protein